MLDGYAIVSQLLRAYLFSAFSNCFWGISAGFDDLYSYAFRLELCSIHPYMTCCLKLAIYYIHFFFLYGDFTI